jgi:spore maturation protein CgeB
MRIVLATNVYLNSRPERGYSTDYYNIYACLKKMWGDTKLFDYVVREKKIGKEEMNKELLQMVIEQRPDMVILILWGDHFIPSVIDEIGKHTTTVYFAYDDMWRTDYVDFWAPHFTYIVTSYIHGVKDLHHRGHNNGLYLSLGCNHNVYTKRNLEKVYDVSFIGSYHPHREWLIHWIRRSGIDVEIWGWGWRNNFISFPDMIDVINQSKINLNLSNETSWDLRYMLSSPKAFINTFRSSKHFAPINVRIFEINGCGGFQILPYMEGLEKRYNIGDELVVFQRPEQLVERIHYYLEHEEEREDIASQGYERTLKDHTMGSRFHELCERIGIKRT